MELQPMHGDQGRLYHDDGDEVATDPVMNERGAPSKPVVVGWTWSLRIFVALVILIQFLGILAVVSWLYPKGG
jgi:hypothetical protein